MWMVDSEQNLLNTVSAEAVQRDVKRWSDILLFQFQDKSKVSTWVR